MRSMVFQAAVVGASGYAGGEVVRLLDEHPGFEVAVLDSSGAVFMVMPQAGLWADEQIIDDLDPAYADRKDES